MTVGVLSVCAVLLACIVAFLAGWIWAGRKEVKPEPVEPFALTPQTAPVPETPPPVEVSKPTPTTPMFVVTLGSGKMAKKLSVARRSHRIYHDGVAWDHTHNWHYELAKGQGQ